MTRTRVLGAVAAVAALWCVVSALLQPRGGAADELPPAVAFVEVAIAGRASPTPALRAAGRAGRGAEDTSTPSAAWSAAPAVVGALLLAGGAAAAGGRARTRVALRVGQLAWSPTKQKMQLIQNDPRFEVIPSRDTTDVMTEEDADKFVKQKIDNLIEMMPLTDEEYEETMAYNKYFWAFPQVAFRQTWNRRQAIAKYKHNCARIHKPYLDDFRLIKPLIMKHPNFAKRWVTEVPDKYGKKPESIRQKLDGNWIHGEERSAGFTYEDWTRETDGATFESWKMPEMGEIVPGVIAAYHKNGCFVEVGAKTWAFMPLKFLSLVPVNFAEEAGLKIGDQVSVKVLSTIADSPLLSDFDCKFTVVSITEILRENAMAEVESKMRGDEGTSPLFEVVVEFFKPFGAVVRTTSGLPGFIATGDLGDLAGNTRMLGQTITVEVLPRFTDRELLNNMNPQGPSEFGLRFSYKNAASRELSTSKEEGEVVEGVISAIFPATLELKVPTNSGGNATVEVRKVDICKLLDWEIAERFTVGETIKAYVLSVLPATGEVRLSMRALDEPAGIVLYDKEKYNSNAEENAKVYFEKATVAKEKFASMMEDTLDDKPSMGAAKKGTVDDDFDDLF